MRRSLAKTSKIGANLFKKSRKFAKYRRKCDFVMAQLNLSQTSISFTGSCLNTPEAPRKLVESFLLNFEKTRKFMKITIFGVMPGPMLIGKFSKTHRRTCHLHSWINFYLGMVAKLVRSETNSQILRNLHFCQPLGARGKPSTFVYRAG